ncbi:MAG: division/cell wall cluster transcriptional repressor MraZ [Candidatus Vogelbacteria bacterium CG10_big_fil_rev_8_21_14_0_10_50_13]|uniref:Transcriptional regulator MraZ n=1 Tax=Candidatus Vogelbacteria bacterium CG10_big_fil_rev_8_21_14_0_10_50_13 TaxID=1975044 RepID=A0A2H0RG04_9BACT|nr:MAG: division/cell wall cluster transcriptional repressor MraZ [Candidatus Vogelbacteria bacterium CG10_big_fil_rev_8_21_14_0_10_50_13]
MLIGEFRHSIDDKKRVAVPRAFRQELGKKVVVTRGLDNCLFLYPKAEWQKMSEKLASLPMGQANSRGFSRFVFGGASEAEIDSLGRVLIPDFLKKFAGLATKVVLAGVNNRVEIWDEYRWDEHTKAIEREADRLAEKLGEIGIF